MANNAGEMPFLDHLEELRKRILLALVGVIIGLGIGWGLTRHFKLIQVIEGPIVPFLPSGKLMVTTAIAPFMLNLKFAMILGVVLSSPWVLYQLWLFLAPALTGREKKSILPSLGIGLLLFLGGAAIGWFYVLTPTLKWLLTYDPGTFNVQITYESYMELTFHLLVAMGIAAELPLVMILLASLGLVSYQRYKKFRRFAIFFGFVGGAILSPAPEVAMMTLFTIPLLLLYEVGVFGSYLVEKRKARAAAQVAAGALFFVLCLTPHSLHAQIPPPVTQQLPPGSRDTSRRVTGAGVQKADSSTLKRLGIPAAPSHPFGTPDSVMQALLAREGFASTRFGGDSVRYIVSDERILLGGNAATFRNDAQLEADQIVYDNPNCVVTADGSPRMFEKGQSPTIGRTMRVKICDGEERGVIGEAFTSMAQGGANWFIRGNIAADSGGKRLFIAGAEFTSCDLPDPHYHFKAGETKWVSQSVIVARPAVLYIRDVPVAWLPFIFQDTKRDRSSGILIPRFGFNDIVRTNRNYNRTVSNVGYYWAPNDYMDATVSFDWYANRYTQYTGSVNYRWLDRFIDGSVRLSKQVESDGSSSNSLHWDHRQSFDVTTSLTFSLNYVSDSRIQLSNAIDPYASTQSIDSRLNGSKRFRWGTVTIGGTRTQALGTGTGTMTLPSLSVQPKAVALGSNIVWSPSLNVTNTTGFNNPQTPLAVFSNGMIDTLTSSSHSRNTSIDFNTPLQIYGLNFQNRVRYNDQQFVGRVTSTQRNPNPTTTGGDSVTVVQGGNFATGIDWDPSISLPLIAHGTWNITPSIGVSNVLAGTSMVIRSAASNGDWVWQGKKVRLQLDMAPTFFGFLNGVGPFTKFRYTLAPTMSVQWSPSASVSDAFARASSTGGIVVDPSVPATTLATFSLHQTIEGKFKAAVGDTNTDPTHLRKQRLLSVSTSPISYDFEQAKLLHRTGWTTSVLTNSFQSDLLPALTLSTTHSLWDGVVGTDSAKFSPFLSGMNATLQITGGTFRALGRLIGLGHKDTTSRATGPAAQTPLTNSLLSSQYGGQRPGGPYQPPPARGLTLGLNFSLNRTRTPNGPTVQPVSTEPTFPGSISDPLGLGTIIPIIQQPAQSQLGINLAFAPTAFWSVTWNTQYDITHGTFLQQNIVLQRDLHDWRASFTFTKNSNGNFGLYFTVFLLNLPDIKFDYNQTTLQQAPIQQ